MLRDRLPVDEAAQLAAQLPHLLRGVFYEGWDPSKTPQTYRDRETFLLRMAEAANLAGPTEASIAAEAATDVLADQISTGEMDDVLHVLPKAVRQLVRPSQSKEVT